MHLEPTESLDVIEGICLVTQVALLDRGLMLAGHTLVHHGEMHHEVAGRRLVTLVAVPRLW